MAVHSCPDCRKPGPGAGLPSLALLAVVSAVGISQGADPWQGDLKYAARPEHVRAAHCTRKEPFSVEEMRAWLEDATKGDERVSRMFHGVGVLNESRRLADWLYRLLTVVPRPGKPAHPQPRLSAGCDTAICVAQSIFGEKEGLQLLMMVGRYGINGSHIAFGPAQPWKADELDHVLLALSDFPPSTLPNRAVEGHFVRYPSGANDRDWRGAGTTLADATGVYEGWTRLPVEHRRSFVFHEMAHRFALTREEGGRGETLDMEQRWKSLSGGWNRTFAKLEYGHIVEDAARDPARIVSLYGRLSPMEDFAESMVAYRYNPAALRAASPDKLAFLREAVFDGIDYESAEACANARPNSLRVRESVERELAPPALADARIDRARRACAAPLMQAFLKRQNGPAARACLETSLREDATRAALVALEPRFPSETTLAFSIRPAAAVPRAAVDAAADRALVRLKSFLVDFAFARASEGGSGTFTADADWCSERVSLREPWLSRWQDEFAGASPEERAELRSRAVFDFEGVVRRACEQGYGKRRGLRREITRARVNEAIEELFSR